MPLVVKHWTTTDSGHLIANIRLIEGSAFNAESLEFGEVGTKFGFVVDTQDDDVWVFDVLPGEIRLGGFNSRVAGLDNPLPVGQILADQNVAVRNLQTVHGFLLG